MTCSLHTEVLSSAFHSVLTDKAFDLPSPPAIAARESSCTRRLRYPNISMCTTVQLFFKHLIRQHFPTKSVQSLDYNESNALRYISGYITRSIHRKLKETSHKLEQELCLCLAELNDVDPDEMEDESNVPT